MGDRTDEAGLTTIPWHSSVLYVILTSSLIGVMGITLISPVLPDLRPVFAVTDAQVGLVITAYTLPGIVLTPVIGLIADRIGRKRVIVPLLFVFGITGAGIAFATTFVEVLVLRFFQGIGATALITLAVTMIGDAFEGPRRDAVMGLNGSTIASGAAFYPLIGGALAVLHWNVPFLFFGVGVVVGLVAFFVLEEQDVSQSTDLRGYMSSLRDVVLLPQALAIFVAVFVVFFVFYGAIITALPLMLSDEFGLSSGEIGVVLAMVSVASAAVSSQYGNLSQWRNANELIALGFVAYGASLVGVFVAPSPVIIAGALLAFGVGFGIVMPSIDTAMITLVSAELRAGMMGMRTSMIRLGETLGPVAFTLTAQTVFPTTIVGYRTLLFLAGVAFTIAGVVGYRVVKT